MSLRDYIEAEKYEIVKAYGEFSDKNIRKFVNERGEEFRQNYLRKYNLKSIVEDAEDN